MTDCREMSDSEKKKEDWMNSKWRPMMGWMYMLVCTMDFIVFPIFWSVIQTIGGGRVETQWSPLTLQGAGLFHMAMGAVLGLAAFGRTQEKLAGANNGGAQTSSTGFSLPTSTPATSGGFNNVGSASPIGTNSSGFGGAPSSISTSVNSSSGFRESSAPTTVSSTGKPMPIQPNQPEI